LASTWELIIQVINKDIHKVFVSFRFVFVFVFVCCFLPFSFQFIFTINLKYAFEKALHERKITLRKRFI